MHFCLLDVVQLVHLVALRLLFVFKIVVNEVCENIDFVKDLVKLCINRRIWISNFSIMIVCQFSLCNKADSFILWHVWNSNNSKIEQQISTYYLTSYYKTVFLRKQKKVENFDSHSMGGCASPSSSTLKISIPCSWALFFKTCSVATNATSLPSNHTKSL